MKYWSMKGVKKVKIFKKVNCRIENLKTEILLYFFQKLILEKPVVTFHKFLFTFAIQTCNLLIFYLFLLVLLGLFDQTSVTKLKSTIVFPLCI